MSQAPDLKLSCSWNPSTFVCERTFPPACAERRSKFSSPKDRMNNEIGALYRILSKSKKRRTRIILVRILVLSNNDDDPNNKL